MVLANPIELPNLDFEISIETGNGRQIEKIIIILAIGYTNNFQKNMSSTIYAQ